MKLLFANENDGLSMPVGYEFSDAELEVIKAGNLTLIESADKALHDVQKEYTERIRINTESSKEFQKEITERTRINAEVSTNYAIHQLNWWNNQNLLQTKDDSSDSQ